MIFAKRPRKDTVRKALVLDFTLNHIRKGANLHFATLPNTNWQFEKMLDTIAHRVGARLTFHCFELDPLMMGPVIRYKPSFTASNVLVTRGDILEAMLPRLDGVWLDFCQNCTPDDDIRVLEFLQRNLKPKATVAFTYSLRCSLGKMVQDHLDMLMDILAPGQYNRVTTFNYADGAPMGTYCYSHI